MDEMTFRVPPLFWGHEPFPKTKSRAKCWGAAFHSLQLPCCWAQLWALGMDSEIPVGFVGAYDSQQRNDIHSIRLSRNLPAAGASMSLGPPSSTERMLAEAWCRSRRSVDRCQRTPGGAGVILL